MNIQRLRQLLREIALWTSLVVIFILTHCQFNDAVKDLKTERDKHTVAIGASLKDRAELHDRLKEIEVEHDKRKLRIDALDARIRALEINDRRGR